jgi:Conserved TM helix
VAVQRLNGVTCQQKEGENVFSAIDWTGGLTDAWTKVAEGAPKIVYFLLVLFIGLFVTKIITKAVTKLAYRLNIDSLLEKAGIGKHVRSAGLTGAQLIGKAVKYFLTFVVITTAFAVFGPDNPISKLLDRFVLMLPRVVVAAAIIVITGLVARFAQGMLSRLGQTAEGVEGVQVPAVAIKAAPIAIWFVGGFAAVDQLGVAPGTVRTLFTAALAMIVGIGIVAIGGSGISAMRPRWDSALGKWDAAKSVVPQGDRTLAPPQPVAGE